MADLATYGPRVFRNLEDVRQYLHGRDYHLYNVSLFGADGTATTFTSPLKVHLDVVGQPQAILYQGTGIVLYDQADPPAAGTWTLRRDQKTIVMGTAPGLGEPFVFLEVWGVLP